MKNSPTTKRFFLLFLPTALVLIVAAYVGIYLETGDKIEALELKQATNLQVAANSIVHDFGAVTSDLRMLADNPDLLRYLDSGKSVDRIEAERHFIVLSREKRRYDQVRYLDAHGMERIRVNYDSGSPAVTPRNELQDKSDRYYFIDTMKLDDEEVYVSPFDLNIENGEIEVPYKPMIRFGTPVFDNRGRKRGIVVLNYYGARLLNDFRRIVSQENGDAMMLNRNGYWLSAPDDVDEWGFMLNKQRSFAQRYPAIWKTISTSRQGHVLTPEGLFTFATVFPLSDGEFSAAGMPATAGGNGQASEQYYWKLVSYIPDKSLPQSSLRQYPTTEAIFYSALILALIGSIVLARAWTARSEAQQKLEHLSLHDALTGLPNRILLEEQLHQALARSQRYGRSLAVVYLDLDGFKEVNDRYGHTVGDKLLVSVSQRMKEALREGDTLARMGGDEFAAILADLERPQDYRQIIDRLLHAAAEPAVVEEISLQVSASIGVTLYPQDRNDIDLLVRHADQAMYLAKQSGKNRYQLFEAG